MTPLLSGKRIFVAGHRGLVGSALLEQVKKHDPAEIITATKTEVDLTDQSAVSAFLKRKKPDIVFLAAAKVGGILDNNTHRADFIYQNLMIEANVIHASFLQGVERLIFLGSNCIYPKESENPISEDTLLTGALEYTNEPYAVAKIAGVKLCESYNKQYGTRYLAAMPANIYGPGDHYDLQKCHVFPALIRKVYEAKLFGAEKIVVWGTGTPRREFLHSHDLANACISLASLSDRHVDQLSQEHNGILFNVGSGIDFEIGEITRHICSVIGFDGEIGFDLSKPDGTMKKLLNSNKIKDIGWTPEFDLAAGIKHTFLDFEKRYNNGEFGSR